MVESANLLKDELIFTKIGLQQEKFSFQELFKSLTESIEANNLSPPDSLASLDPTGNV